MVDVVATPSVNALEIGIQAPELHGASRPSVQGLAIAVQPPAVLVDGRVPNIKSLLPLNATAQERALETATSRIGNVKTVGMRTSWDADSCPASLLPWLAWAVSVDAWDASWTEEQKRNSIRNSFLIHKSKGTIGALRRALAAVSFSSEVIEWFNDAEPDADPYTFRLEVFADEVAISDAVYSQIIRIVEETKNVRSHMRRISAVTRIRGHVYLASVLMSGVKTTIYPYIGGEVNLTGLISLSGCLIIGDIITVGRPDDDEEELPDAPVITSSDSVPGITGDAFSYFITATNSPTSYSADGLPDWLTIDTGTGEIFGTPDEAGTIAFVVHATNAGGTGSMVVSVEVEGVLIGDFSAVSWDAECRDVCVIGHLAYVVGQFVTVTDASGTHTRQQAACIDLSTGLFTSWAPVVVASDPKIITDGTDLYIYGSLTSVNGNTQIIVKVLASTGANASWTVSITSGVITANPAVITGALYLSGSIYIHGNLDHVNGTQRIVTAAVDSTTGVTTAFDAHSPEPLPYYDLTGGPGRISTDGTNIFGTGGHMGFSQLSHGLNRFNAVSGLQEAMGTGLSFFSMMEVSYLSGYNRLVSSWLGGYATWQTQHAIGGPSSPYYVRFSWAILDGSGNMLSDPSLVDNSVVRALPDSAEGCFYIGGNFTVVDSNSCPGIFKSDPDGIRDMAWSPVWGASGSLPTVRGIAKCDELDVVIFVGDWSRTINGKSRNYFAVLDSPTGAVTY